MNRIAGHAFVSHQATADVDDEQLLKLFWNRAELKKELGRLRRERDRLMEQVRQQEHQNLRVQQRLDQLENLLADPAEAANAIVYYQLRRVWLLCSRRISRLSRELADRQREREEQRVEALFQRNRESRLVAAESALLDVDRNCRAVEGDWQQVEEQARRLGGFWNYFRRRAAIEHSAELKASLDGLSSRADALRAELRLIELETAPAFSGISIEGRRNINAVLIAMAQQLYLHFAEHDIAVLAQEAAARGLAELSYGNVAECRRLGERIASVTAALDAAERLNVQARRRAEFLQRTVSYRQEGEAVPAATSLDTIPLRIVDVGEPRPADGNAAPVNVLTEDYWELGQSLLS